MFTSPTTKIIPDNTIIIYLNYKEYNFNKMIIFYNFTCKQVNITDGNLSSIVPISLEKRFKIRPMIKIKIVITISYHCTLFVL